MVEPTAERTSQLLTTLLGDYWFTAGARGDHIPSAALAAVLAEFGVGAEATRAALSRSSRRGRLEGARTGRTTAYRLAPAVRDRALVLSRRLMGFGAEPVAWDGMWTCVAFSVPESDRPRRLALRRRLRALGFGALFDGLWISPRAPVDEVDAALRELDIADAAVLRVTEVPRDGGADLLSAWDLDTLRERYDAFVALLGRVAPRLAAGEIGSAEALITRTEVLAAWRDLVAADPALPDELLPDDWPLPAARRAFVAVYDDLGPLAEARVRQLIAPHPATPTPHHHQVADILP
jgi:phenylacetic acid degradation operon negative regulatory protein